MKTREFSSLGLVAKILVPETVEEFDANAKYAGACLTEAVNNVVYRGVLNGVRDIFLFGQKEDKEEGLEAFAGIEQRTGITCPTKETGKRKDGTAIIVPAKTELEYFNYVCAEKNVKPEHFQSIMDEVCALVEFDASQTQRKGARIVKIGKAWLESAEGLVAKNDFGKFESNFKKFVGKDLVHPTPMSDDNHDSAKAEFHKDEKNKGVDFTPVWEKRKKDFIVNAYARLIKEMFDAKEAQELAAGKML